MVLTLQKRELSLFYLDTVGPEFISPPRHICSHCSCVDGRNCDGVCLASPSQNGIEQLRVRSPGDSQSLWQLRFSISLCRSQVMFSSTERGRQSGIHNQFTKICLQGIRVEIKRKMDYFAFIQVAEMFSLRTSDTLSAQLPKKEIQQSRIFFAGSESSCSSCKGSMLFIAFKIWAGCSFVFKGSHSEYTILCDLSESPTELNLSKCVLSFFYI